MTITHTHTKKKGLLRDLAKYESKTLNTKTSIRDCQTSSHHNLLFGQHAEMSFKACWANR